MTPTPRTRPLDPIDDDNTTTIPPAQAPPTDRHCPACQRPFVRIRRQLYCSDACRKNAWSRNHTAAAPIPAPPPGPRRDVTVYACPDCDTRYHGQQWCYDCNKPCTGIGLGGTCPNCEEPIAISDLLDTNQPAIPLDSR